MFLRSRGSRCGVPVAEWQVPSSGSVIALPLVPLTASPPRPPIRARCPPRAIPPHVACPRDTTTSGPPKNMWVTIVGSPASFSFVPGKTNPACQPESIEVAPCCGCISVEGTSAAHCVLLACRGACRIGPVSAPPLRLLGNVSVPADGGTFCPRGGPF